MCVCVFIWTDICYFCLCLLWVGLWVCVFLTACFFVRNISNLHALLYEKQLHADAYTLADVH